MIATVYYTITKLKLLQCRHYGPGDNHLHSQLSQLRQGFSNQLAGVFVPPTATFRKSMRLDLLLRIFMQRYWMPLLVT